jgi:predicted membrane protein
MNANIDGGIGSINVIVPSRVGVRLDGDTGIGAFKAAGFTKSGGAYVNNAYHETDETIRLSIDAGIGEVKVLTDEV